MEQQIETILGLVSGLGFLIALILQVIKKHTADYLNEIGAAIGILVGLMWAWYLQDDYFIYAWAGFIGGLVATGGYEAVKNRFFKKGNE